MERMYWIVTPGTSLSWISNWTSDVKPMNHKSRRSPNQEPKTKDALEDVGKKLCWNKVLNQINSYAYHLHHDATLVSRRFYLQFQNNRFHEGIQRVYGILEGNAPQALNTVKGVLAMLEQPRFPKQSWIPLFTGLFWLWVGSHAGLRALCLSFLPGVLLLSTGVSLLLYPGDKRIQELMSLAGVLAALLALPGLFFLGFFKAVLLLVLSLGCSLAAASATVRQAPRPDEIPPPIPSLRLFFQTAVDNAMLALVPVFVSIPSRDDMARIQRECDQMRELFEQQGWDQDPETYHTEPQDLANPGIQTRKTRGWLYEHLSFDSGYEPYPEEPGKDRWMGYRDNRTAHAWVMRHSDPNRSWLICIHGYQMGFPLVDLSFFEAAHLHQELGLNLLFPVLPLHGNRRKGRISGDGFLSGDVMDALHAEAQAMWDIRRMIRWIRAQGGARIGVTGLSLGGYNTALLASLEGDMTCAIPGIPLADMADIFWHHGPPLQLRAAEAAGFTSSMAAQLLRPVAPLVLQPKVAKERRLIFGGVVDQQVPPKQIRDLWRHWDKPQILWYQGSHVTFMMHPHVRQGVDEFFEAVGLVPATS